MNRLSNFLSAATLFAGVAMIAPAQAQDHAHHAQAGVAHKAAGEVVKVDKAAAKITIKHGPLESLNMPGMTMVFKAGSAAMLNQVKAGDKISFAAEKIKGTLTVTAIDIVL